MDREQQPTTISMKTATQLFAASRGVTLRDGANHCYYCGGSCGKDVPAADVVKSSFTSRDTVCGGEWVCDGCVEAMDERGEASLPDGQRRTDQKIRCYSWVVAGGVTIAATKAHRDWLYRQCVEPPTAPFVICISDSGQKHLLYRAVVSHSREVVCLTLEGDRVSFRPADLQERYGLCCRLIAATGKPAIDSGVSPSVAMRIIQHWGDESLVSKWLAVRQEPLSRLALWLAPNKEVCVREYPTTAAAN